VNISGFYEVDFSAVTQGAKGVVFVDAGQVHGADDQYLYSGSISGEEQKIRVELKVKAYAAGAQDVFGNQSRQFQLTLDGKIVGNDIHLDGPSPSGAGAGIRIKAIHLAPPGLF
jgi:hypothetical protein